MPITIIFKSIAQALENINSTFLTNVLYGSIIGISDIFDLLLVSAVILIFLPYLIISYYLTSTRNIYFILLYFIIIYIIFYFKNFILFINNQINTLDYDDFYIPLLCTIISAFIFKFMLKKNLWK